MSSPSAPPHASASQPPRSPTNKTKRPPPSNPTPFSTPNLVPMVPLDDDDINAAPLHLHALKITPTLAGSGSTTGSAIAKHHHQRRRSNSLTRSRSRSRSSSRSRQRGGAGAPASLTATTGTPSSTSSSRDVSPFSSSQNSFVDIEPDDDIFLDKLGMLELQQADFDHNSLDAGSASAGGGSSKNLTKAHHTLPSVNERMSEESLDDVHAFTELKSVIREMKIPNSSSSSLATTIENNLGQINTTTSSDSDASGAMLTEKNLSHINSIKIRSRESSMAGSILGDTSCLLETLREFEDEEDDEDDQDKSEGDTGKGRDETEAGGEDTEKS